jgi:hypothetical protein
VTVVIAGQYALAKLHPATFGQDLSNRDYVGWDPQQSTFYYNTVFFRALGTGTLALVSTLCVVALVVGLLRRDRSRVLASAALLAGVASMSLLFTVKVDRYAFVVLPLLFALGALGGSDVLDGLRRLAGSDEGGRWARWPALTGATGALGVLVLLASMAQSPRDFSLVAARATGTTTTFRHIDYQHAADYVAAHQRPGDTLLTLAPPDVPAHYLGRVPDAIVQTGRNKLLYLIEKNGRAVDTIYGVRSILTGAELDAYLAGQPRVWLISDLGGYLQSIPPDLRTSVLTHFQLVYVGAGSSVWLWSP